MQSQEQQAVLVHVDQRAALLAQKDGFGDILIWLTLSGYTPEELKEIAELKIVDFAVPETDDSGNIEKDDEGDIVYSHYSVFDLRFDGQPAIAEPTDTQVHQLLAILKKVKESTAKR